MRVMLATRLLLTIVVIACTAAWNANALAAPSWTRVTTTSGQNIEEVSSARTADGVLHVVWAPAIGGTTSNQLLQTTVAPTGQVGTPIPLAGGWAGIANPAIAVRADGALVVAAGAQRSIESTDPILNQAMWTSTDGGVTWNLFPSDIATGSGAADPVSLAFGPDGSTPFTTWGTSFGLFVHRGTEKSVAAIDLQGGAGWNCCGYEPGIAPDPTGNRLIVGWFSNASGHDGVYAQAIDPGTGAAIGSPLLLPGTSQIGAPSERTPVVALPGAGVYLAAPGGYPTTTQALVWGFGSTAATTVGQSASGVADVGVATDPASRLWAFWATGSGQTTLLHARRSSPGAKRWGAEVTVHAPAGASELWKLDGNAQAGLLDLLGSFSVAGTTATWDSQVLPGLSLSASASGQRSGKLTATVTDAGQAVAGATVRASGHTAKTNNAGVAHFSLGGAARGRNVRLSATKTGYTSASIVVRVPG